MLCSHGRSCLGCELVKLLSGDAIVNACSDSLRHDDCRVGGMIAIGRVTSGLDARVGPRCWSAREGKTLERAKKLCSYRENSGVRAPR